MTHIRLMTWGGANSVHDNPPSNNIQPHTVNMEELRNNKDVLSIGNSSTVGKMEGTLPTTSNANKVSDDECPSIGDDYIDYDPHLLSATSDSSEQSGHTPPDYKTSPIRPSMEILSPAIKDSESLVPEDDDGSVHLPETPIDPAEHEWSIHNVYVKQGEAENHGLLTMVSWEGYAGEEEDRDKEVHSPPVHSSASQEVRGRVVMLEAAILSL